MRRETRTELTHLTGCHGQRSSDEVGAESAVRNGRETLEYARSAPVRSHGRLPLVAGRGARPSVPVRSALTRPQSRPCQWHPQRLLPSLPLLLLSTLAHAQSSSLYVQQPPRLSAPAQPPAQAAGRADRPGPPVNPYLQRMSYTAVAPPEPRRFAVHDLITIVIREQSVSTSESTLETQKDTTFDGGINAFPHFEASDLLNLRLRNSDSPENLPQLDVEMNQEFEGEGEYERRDTMTTRLTARVVDVKPNGMLTLEARTQIRNDEETQTITVTGYCQPQDVSIDNTVLSTQMFDLRVTKTNEGELRDSGDKGFLTEVLETIFNF